MRISIISNGFQESYTYDLINGLAQASSSDQIELIGSSIYQSHKFDKKIIYTNLGGNPGNTSLLNKISRNIHYYFKLPVHIRKNRTNIVHLIWLNLTLIDGIIIPLILRLAGIKVCYTAHDVLPHSRDHFLNRILFYFIYRIPHKLFVHTDFIKKRIVHEFGIQPEKITVVKHGIYSVKSNPKLDKSSARNITGIAAEDIVILFFGIITKYKGLNLLLEAINIIKDDLRSYHLIIAGRVDDKYKQEFDFLLSKYKTLKVIVNNGFIEDEKVEQYFKSADVTVLPYLEASQSGVLFLSYTFGVPVIAPELGGFPDDIVSGKTGILFDAGNSESLGRAIQKFYREIDFRSPRTNEFIRNYSNEHYSWSNTGRTLIRVYSELNKSIITVTA